MNYTIAFHTCEIVGTSTCSMETWWLATLMATLPNDTSLYDTAAFFAKLSMALHDALALHLQFGVWFLWPKMAFKAGDTQHPPTPNWTRILWPLLMPSTLVERSLASVQPPLCWKRCRPILNLWWRSFQTNTHLVWPHCCKKLHLFLSTSIGHSASPDVRGCPLQCLGRLDSGYGGCKLHWETLGSNHTFRCVTRHLNLNVLHNSLV